MVGHPVGALRELGEAELRLAPFVVDHPERRAVVPLRLNVKVVERPVELLERRPAKAGIRRGVIVAVRDQEIARLQERPAAVHDAPLTSETAAPACGPDVATYV